LEYIKIIYNIILTLYSIRAGFFFRHEVRNSPVEDTHLPTSYWKTRCVKFCAHMRAAGRLVMLELYVRSLYTPSLRTAT